MKQYRGLTLFLLPLAALALVGAGTDHLGFGSDGVYFPDGTVLRSAAGSTANVVVVAKSGGHYTSIQEALDSITDSSESNPYLVWVAPGVYREQVRMKEWVDIQGAGEGTTRITFGTAPDADSSGEFVVVGADYAELRDLTVVNTSVGNLTMAIFNGNASPRLTRVTAEVSTALWAIAVFNSASSPTMTHVTARSFAAHTCTAVLNVQSSARMVGVVAEAWDCAYSRAIENTDGSAPTMTNVVARATGGTKSWAVYNHDSSSPTMLQLTAVASGGAAENLSLYISDYSSAQIHNSTLRGDMYITDQSAGSLAHSQLVGDVVAGEGACTCVGAYDGNFEALGEHCLGGPS